MANNGLIDKTTHLLQKSLDLRQQRLGVIASNVANSDTPRYAARTLEFEARLQQALQQPPMASVPLQPRHFPIGNVGFEQIQGQVEQHPDRSGQGDGNNVSVEDEMIALSENQILYEATARLTKRKLQLLKYAVNDGR